MDRADLKKTLMDIFERCVGEPVAAIEETTRLKEDLSLDSIDVVSMAIEVQSEFNIDLKAEELTGVVTIKDLLDLILVKLRATENRAA
jgi:acyl carrier protein